MVVITLDSQSVVYWSVGSIPMKGTFFSLYYYYFYYFLFVSFACLIKLASYEPRCAKTGLQGYLMHQSLVSTAPPTGMGGDNEF